MNRKKNFSLGKKLFTAPQSPQFDACKARLPIIAVENVRRLGKPTHQRDRCTAKKSKAFEVIPITINFSPRKIMISLEKIRGRIQFVTLPDANARPLPAPLHFQIFERD